MFGQKNYYEKKIDMLERKIKALEDHKVASDELIATQKQLIASKDEIIAVNRQLIAEKERLIQVLMQKGN